MIFVFFITTAFGQVAYSPLYNTATLCDEGNVVSSSVEGRYRVCGQAAFRQQL